MDKENLEIFLDNLERLKVDVINSINYKRVPAVLLNRAVEKSADYVEKNMPEAIIFTASNKTEMWNCAISKLTLKGHIAEFGVFEGTSINYLANLIYPKPVFGFDSFLGLEEDFPLDCPKGQFNLNGILPKVLDNVTLIKGSFSESLPKWLLDNDGAFSLINIDCDTYQATTTVLNSLGPERIVSGTFILFDEYFGFYGWEQHEFKAWQEYCKKYDLKYRYVAVCHLQVLIEIL
jgi:hypothetical protein